MDFDPDAYIQQKTAGFDPDAYLSDKQSSLASETPLAASAAAGAIQSVPFSGQIGAAGKTAMDVLTGVTSPRDAVDEYRTQRDLLKKDLGQKEQAHPYAALAGSIPGMAAIPGLGAAGAEGFAGYGAAQGVSNSQADLTKGEVGPALDDALKSGATAGVIGGAAETAAPLLKGMSQPVSDYLAAKLKNVADRSYLAATKIPGATAYNKLKDNAVDVLRKYVGFGDTQRDIAEKLGVGREQAGQAVGDLADQLTASGATIDEKNAVLESLKARQQALLKNAGDAKVARALQKNIDDIQATIDARTTRTPISYGDDTSPFTAVEEKIGKPGEEQTVYPDTFTPASPDYSQLPPKAINPVPGTQGRLIRPTIAAKMGELGSEADEANLQASAEYGYNPYGGAGAGSEGVTTQLQPVTRTGVTERPEIPFNQGVSARQSFDTTGKWNGINPSEQPGAEASRITANTYREAEEDAAQQADPELAKQYLGAKQDFSDVTDLAELAGKKASVYSQGPALNLHALRPGAIGAAVGGEEGYRHGGLTGALAGAAAGAIAGPRALSSSAVSADFLAKVVRNAPETLAQWAPTLSQAAARGPSALNATDYILQQIDPDYRQHLSQLKAQQGQTLDE